MGLIISTLISLTVSIPLFYIFSQVIEFKVIESSSEEKRVVKIIETQEEVKSELQKEYSTGTPAVDKRVSFSTVPKGEFQINRVKSDIEVQISREFVKPDISFNNSNSEALNSVEITTSGGISLQGVSLNLQPLFRSEPSYPLKARLLKKEGFVKALLTIDESGRVEKVQTIESSPEGLFEESTERAIMRWKFQPKIVNGKAVKQRAIQLIEFRL